MNGAAAEPADVVVIGDGPAGSALARGCTRRGLTTILVGPDADWEATYGCWLDDLAGLDDPGHRVHRGVDGDRPSWFASSLETLRVVGDRMHVLARPYGIIDNAAMKNDLRTGVAHRTAHVERVEHGQSHHRVVLARDDVLAARLVIDAAGWPSRFAPEAARGTRATQPAWQTALGVVLAEPPDGSLGVPTLMDLRAVRAGSSEQASTIGPSGVDTFAYSMPVADGWLVEETVLAARPAVEPVALLARLAGRLGRHPDELLADAVRSEYVRIPMGGALPASDQPVVAFGAAGGLVHPATGYSVGASLRAVPRVVDRIEAAAQRPGPIDPSAIWDGVWPPALRRTRVLHDVGLDTLMRLDGRGVAGFFDAFFDLPVEEWSAYLRIDTAPAETANVMTQLFRSSSWSMRRKLASGNPVRLARLLRP
jgi:lycopene beta-cyclase